MKNIKGDKTQKLYMTDNVDFTHEIAKAIYNLGSMMVYDDRGDLGYTTYYGRHSHKYHGKTSPNHPSPIHHYQIGSLLVMLSQVFALGGLANDLKGIADDADINNTDNNNTYGEFPQS